MESKATYAMDGSSKKGEPYPPNPPPLKAQRKAEAKELDDTTKPKAHWSTTEEGALVAKANAFVHRKIITSAEDGGLLEYFEKHCYSFESVDYEKCAQGEYTIEHYSLFQEYEAKIEQGTFETTHKCSRENPY